jgi:hypothetical protein
LILLGCLHLSSSRSFELGQVVIPCRSGLDLLHHLGKLSGFVNQIGQSSVVRLRQVGGTLSLVGIHNVL